jgi:alkylation response protein AidB-like acyl-CoA dehydrogenase
MKSSPGFTVARNESKLGSRGIPSSELHLDNVFIPADKVLGEEGKAFKLVMEAFNKSRPIIGARGVGLAQGAIDLAVRYAKQREAFGQPIAQYQGLQWMIADMVIQTEASRQLVYKAASLVDSGATGLDLAPFAAMSKCFATDTAMKVATDAVQIFGSQGISKDNPIERYFRDAKVLQIIEGTNQIQRNIVARHTINSID